VILEVEQAVTRVVDVLGTALVDAAVQVPADPAFPHNEVIVTHVVPSTADGDLVMIDGVIDLDKLARALVDGLGLAGVVE
jgi:hypothetical protein